MYLTIRGLVIRVTDYNDFDSLLTILTRERGKLTVKARGLRRKNSPLIAPCQLLAYGEFTLFEYRDQYTINDAAALELFPGLRKDLEKLALGSYFAQAAEVISQEDMPSGEMLNLALNCLYVLSHRALPQSQVKAVFELRAACLAGYMPDLTGCRVCGARNPDRFDIFAGCLECDRCRDPGSQGLRMPLTPGLLDAMRYVCTCEPKRLFSFSLPPETMARLAEISESYLSTQLERGFSALDFYKSLFFSGNEVH